MEKLLPDEADLFPSAELPNETIDGDGGMTRTSFHGIPLHLNDFRKTHFLPKANRWSEAIFFPFLYIYTMQINPQIVISLFYFASTTHCYFKILCLQLFMAKKWEPTGGSSPMEWENYRNLKMAFRWSSICISYYFYMSRKKWGIVPSDCCGSWNDLETLKRRRGPRARYVIWSWIDQKSCLKCIVAAGRLLSLPSPCYCAL